MPPHFHPALSATVWENKKRIEILYNDFPDINVSAPDFDIKKYVTLLREILQSADIPLHPISTTWEDLKCSVPISTGGAVDTVVSCFTGLLSAVTHGCARIMTPQASGKPSSASVLQDVSGYLLPGQLCLVLGSSGSGTSLLLSRIAGREIPKIIETAGDVSYHTVFAPGQEKPTHFTRYIGQHDVHIPELTVRQTLEFAAECIWPAWIPHVDAIRRNEVILTARTLGIERTLDTIVGSDILRGVSGGERKRVTIAEMQIGGVAGTLIMDNWSKGLDSGTTLSITQAVRGFADVLQGSAMLSMQAPGSEVYALFDTLCILDKGQLLYFGPAGEAESYFNGFGFYRPPHRSLPDFLSTIADPLIQTEYLGDRLSQSNGKALGGGLDTDTLATKFRESEHYAKVQETIASVKAQPRDETLRPKEHIAKIGAKDVLQSPRYQIQALARRQWRHIMSTRRSFLAEVVQNLVLGLLLGSIFWQLPDTAGGANSRGGILFLMLLMIGLSSLAKMPVRFEEKEVFAKQKAAAFFAAWPYLLTQLIFDLCQELIKTAALVLPVYLMAGLNLGGSAQRLLYCVLIIVLVSLTMISMTRFIAAIFDDPESASGVAGVLTIILVLLNGYLKTPTEIQGYLIWIYWSDPLHYAFEALLINEYDGLSFSCAVEELIPANPNIPPQFRVCPVSTGEQYLEDTFGITNGKIFRLYFFLALLGFQVLFFFLSAFATARTKPKGHPRRESSKFSDAGSVQRSDDKDAVAIDVQGSPPASANKNRFTFTNMSYSVDDGRKALLQEVTGNAVGGKVVLLMGESGAGKTTLLDVCAMRKTLGKGTTVNGEVRLNGRVLDKKALAHLSGYCEQSDLHVEEATVREALLFSAKLRLPKSMAMKEKVDRVDEVLTMLRLEPYQHVLVKALGAGEKKLVTMGVEVVTDPKVLFLDEPTSGISSSSAMTVARALRRIAETGTCVVCTVHQPSAEVFDMFDMLLLLKRGGRVVYFGNIGEHGTTLRSYFEARGAERMNEDTNAAAWMLDVISDEKTDWAQEWQQSKEKEERDKETGELAGGDDESSDGWSVGFDTPPFPKQAVEVIRRQFWRYWRLPEYNSTRITLLLMIALMVGLLFLRELSNTQTGAMLSFAALFLTIIPSTLVAQNVIPPTTSGRAVFYREIASGTYKPTAHHVAVGLVELPFTVVATSVFVVVFYFMVGLTPSRFGYFFLASQFLYLFAVMLGVMFASITPTAPFAENLVSSVLSLLNVLSGFFIRKDEMRPWWRWSVWVNPFSYYLSGLVQNEMENKTFICEAGEFGVFRLPDGVSDCSSIAGGVYDNIVENGVVTACNFCPVPTGQTLIDSYAADEVNKWVSLVAIVVATVICRAVTGFGFAKLRFLTR